ncbi:GNAT family N-acetyltransferase [Photobacterium sagamiensis]|uniref:GNAT family N-acetyltransferase n=1 Tax=Photobacterium sagamiensis TaxID=2910241 RepID=UPI003D09E566
MKYRIATLKDAEKIADLHARSWRESYRDIFPDSFLDKDVWDDRKACWLARLAKPKYNQHVVVVMDNDIICGFVCAFGNEDPNWGTFIDNLHVSRSYKGKGVGKSLMRMVAKWSMDNFPNEGLYLEVLEDNITARGFYDALGATHQETRLWQPPGSTRKVNDLLYVWKSIECMGLKVG